MLSPFKQQVAAYFDQRTHYDQGHFHPYLAQRLLAHADLQSGQRVLDVATGTGLVAIAAAERVGPAGYVLGVDISPGMLAQAQRKIQAAGLLNIDVRSGDVEALDLTDACFDWVFCCSSLPYFTDIPAALRECHRCLKPGGQIGLAVFAETAFVAGQVLQQVAQNYGIELPLWNDTTGTPAKCQALLQTTAFLSTQIITEQLGGYLNPEQVYNLWEITLKNPLAHALLQLSAQQQAQAKADYVTALSTIATQQGIWNDVTTFFCFGRKQV